MIATWGEPVFHNEIQVFTGALQSIFHPISQDDEADMTLIALVTLMCYIST